MPFICCCGKRDGYASAEVHRNVGGCEGVEDTQSPRGMWWQHVYRPRTGPGHYETPAPVFTFEYATPQGRAVPAMPL